VTGDACDKGRFSVTCDVNVTENRPLSHLGGNMKSKFYKVITSALAISVMMTPIAAAQYSLFGDIDGNNIVELRDLVGLVQSYGLVNTSKDLTGDGIVDIYDLVHVSKRLMTLGTSKWGDKSTYWSGGTNDAVVVSQKILLELGFLIDPISTNPTDGWFGDFTKMAVMRFQRQYLSGLGDRFGDIGADTAEKLSEVYNSLNRLSGSDREIYIESMSYVMDGRAVGDLTIQYESGGDPGEISTGTGDYLGGKSYGAFQFSSKQGTVRYFIDWLQFKNMEFYDALRGSYVSNDNPGESFDAVWLDLANNHNIEFFMLQYEYTKEEYFDDLASRLMNNQLEFDVSGRSYTLKGALFSRAVQHGVSGAIGLLEGVETNTEMSLNNLTDEVIIREIYEESGKVVDYPLYDDSIQITESNIISGKLRQMAIDNGLLGKYMYYYSRSSPDVQLAVWKRLNMHENIVALDMLRYEIGEIGYSSQGIVDVKEEKDLDPMLWQNARTKADEFEMENAIINE